MTPRAYPIALLGLALFFLPLKIVTFNWSGEDCFITYRVAENFAAGHGFVYNPGEAVEAHSNFLWTVLLAAGARMGLPTPTLGKVLSALCVSALIFLLGWIRPVEPGERREPVELLAPALCLFHPMIHYQCDRALETCFYTLLLALALFFWLRRRPVPVSLALAAVALTRPEGFGFFGVAVALSLLEAARRRNGERALDTGNSWYLARLIAPFVVVFGVFLGWRLATYGQLLPNTVYAKTAPGNFWRNPAFHDILQFLISWSYLPLWAALAVFAPARAKERSWLNGLAFFAGATLLYVLAVGRVQSSAFRYFVPAVPFVALLLQTLARQWRGAGPAASRLGLAAMVGLIFVLTAYTSDNRDHPRSRSHARIGQFLRRPDPVARWRWFFAPPIRLDAEVGRWLRERFRPETTAVSGQMGQLGYYGGLRMIDVLGLADAHVAHHGFSLDYALERDPDLWVILCQGGRPLLPLYDPILDSEAFRERYEWRWSLRARYGDPTFLYRVYRHRGDGLPTDDAPETIEVGVSEAEFRRCYRL